MAKKSMITRPLEQEEFVEVIKHIIGGFNYQEQGKEKVFRPNRPIALALQLQATLGLRISDVLELKVSNFKNGKLETNEKKTGKLQYRDINNQVYNYIMDYAIENKLDKDSKLFSIGIRAVQKQLKIVTDHLGLDNIGTHSFRKKYATEVYENSDSNIYLVMELLNHSSIENTKRYIQVNQKAINQASASVNNIVMM